MAAKVRRVVTGHDANGKAIVLIDDQASNLKESSKAVSSALLWMTDTMPPKIAGTEDMGARDVTRAPPRGASIFRVVEFMPGNPRDMHITPSIDYAVVMTGEIDMELDDGVEVHLKAGDVVVQRGTIHNWINRGKEPCTIAFILINTEV